MRVYKLPCPECQGRTGCDCNVCMGRGTAFLTPSLPAEAELSERIQLREAVRVLASLAFDAHAGMRYIRGSSEPTKQEGYACFYHSGVGFDRVEEKMNAVNANPIARAAVDAAGKERE